jgi:hypothetical protein
MNCKFRKRGVNTPRGAITVMTRRLSVKIPKDYKIQFERKNKEYDLGYSSFPEFIRDCMRRRFNELESTRKKDM